MWIIQNHETEEIIPLSRDVSDHHPAWVHRQCGTSSESDLQQMLDGMTSDDYGDNETDENGIGYLDEWNGDCA